MAAAVYEFQDGVVWLVVSDEASELQNARLASDARAELLRRFGDRQLRFYQQLRPNSPPLKQWPEGSDLIVRFQREGDRIQNAA